MLHRLLRRLLELDKPVPDDDPQRFADEAQRNYRWNLGVSLLDNGSFSFSRSFMAPAVILPLYVHHLTDSKLALGLVVMIAQGGWYLPQVFTANLVEGLHRKKSVVVNLGLFLERLPMTLLVLSALLAVRWPRAALAVFLVGYAWHMLGAGAVATSWQNLVARWCPVTRRGRFLGTAQFVGYASGAVATLFSAWLLKRLAFPWSFVCLFALATSFIFLSWCFLSLTREPLRPARNQRNGQRAYLAQLPAVLRNDLNFRRFLAARILLALGTMGTGFIAVYAVKRWHLPDSVGGLFTLALLIGQTLGNLIFGFLADRLGHKRPLEIAGALAAVAFVLCIVAPSHGWFYAVFALTGASMAAILVCGILVVLEFCPEERVPTYAGLSNTIVGLAGMLGGLLGWLLARQGYGWLFAASAALNVAGLLLMRYGVREPRHAPVPLAPQAICAAGAAPE